jgi:hypothetical protein
MQEGERRGGPRGKEEGERDNWAGPMRFGLLPSLFSFLFYTQTFKQNCLNSNNFEFKPVNSTQLKQCSSMNAQAS